MGCNCGKRKSVAQPKQKIVKTTPTKTGSDNKPNPRIIRRKVN